MKHILIELYDMTLDLIKQIEDIKPEQLIELVELRAKVIAGLQEIQNLPPDFKAMLVELSNYDAIILNRMDRFKDEAQQSIGRIKASRAQRVRYEHAYTMESYFIDKKK